jgi:hypothetical protein
VEALPDLRRTVVAGASGSGKTTFAAKLSSSQLDVYLRKPCPPAWVSRGPEMFVALLEPEVAQDRGAADASLSSAGTLLVALATWLSWLLYPLRLVFGRALRRTVRRVPKREPTHRCNSETFADAFLSLDGVPWWVLRMHRRRGRPA